MTIMVDTGASYSLISPALADRLGVVRFPQRLAVTLADGRVIQAEVGQVRVEIDGRIGMLYDDAVHGDPFAPDPA